MLTESDNLYCWGQVIEYINIFDVLRLRGVSLALFDIFEPIIEKDKTIRFRVPYGERIRTLPYCSVIAYSADAIKYRHTRHLEVTVLNNFHCNTIFAALTNNLITLNIKYFNEPCTRLPPTLTHLVTADEFNHPVDGALPPTLQHLTFGIKFNQTVNNLPQTLTHLIFGARFQQTVENLPISLTHLYFMGFYGEALDKLPQALIYLWLYSYEKRTDKLPATLKDLTLGGGGGHFNKLVDHLPKGLTDLTLGEHFNHRIDRLPPALLRLTIGGKFNRPLKKLPYTLTHLSIGNFKTPGDFFNREIDRLPHSVTHIIVGNNFNKPLDRLPRSLLEISTGKAFHQPSDMIKLPRAAEHIKRARRIPFTLPFDKPSININQLANLPRTLKSLTLPQLIADPIDSSTHCIMGHQFDHDVERQLSAMLTYLDLGGSFNRSVEHLPMGITQLVFGQHFNQSVDHLPAGLTHLTFGANFNHRVKRLPKGLIHLTFGACFNHSVDKLPRRLTHLITGYWFNHDIDELPSLITHLTLGQKFQQRLAIPPLLQHLFIAEAYTGNVVVSAKCQVTVRKYYPLPSKFTRYIADDEQWSETYDI